MPLLLSDYECKGCGHEFEELADRDNPNSVKCPLCGQFNPTRLITGTRIDPRLGLDPTGFPTMGDKWARTHRQAAQIERKRNRAHD
jgi:putative FmdB family regulatory protein